MIKACYGFCEVGSTRQGSCRHWESRVGGYLKFVVVTLPSAQRERWVVEELEWRYSQRYMSRLAFMLSGMEGRVHHGVG
jgi:hypothetical protein